MGEFADYVLDAMEDEYPGRGTRRGDRFDSKRCNHCGKGNLHWVHTGERWALADGKGLHRCSAPATAEEFEDLS